MSLRRLLPLLALLISALALPQAAFAQANEVQTTWRLLDYIAVDYAGAVAGGKVISDGEYKEMLEFGSSVSQRLAALPAGAERDRLVAGAKTLNASIAAKADPTEVDRQARALADALLRAFPVPLAPPSVPDPARGAALYADNCAACHGARGDARAPLAAGMDPPPIAFTDRARANERSIFALYQVIDQGLEDTAMASFRHLPAEDRWALALHAGRFAFPAALEAEGKRIWESDSALRGRIPDLAALTALTPAALGRDIGPEKAAAVTAFLRANPGAVAAKGPGSLDLARERLRQSLEAYEAGQRKQAEELALSAYLDGFEPVEAVLASRDGGLMRRIEAAMAEVRAAIGRGEPVPVVRERIEALDGLFAEAETALDPSAASGTSAFLGAFTILLREGLEALLIVVAMLAFLRKAERPAMVRNVHYGWIAALGAGVATWWAATNLIGISGASRELTEGFGSLLAAIVLLFVGIWMHGKAQADEWQRYIRAKVDQALGRGSAWFLFLLAFVAVYREVFETILFFAALSAQGNGPALLAGGAAALALLAVIAVAMLRFSRKLPIAKFFSYSAILMAILTVVLAGKGVAALQEAGLFGVTPVPGVPTISILGLFPTAEALIAQAVSIAALLLGFRWNRRERPREAVA
ncbi:MAG TPA: FTR1 family protein [Allosphingosinicella sp.]